MFFTHFKNNFLEIIFFKLKQRGSFDTHENVFNVYFLLFNYFYSLIENTRAGVQHCIEKMRIKISMLIGNNYIFKMVLGLHEEIVTYCINCGYYYNYDY